VIYKPLRLTDVLRDGRPMGLWTQRVEPDEIDETVAGTAHLFQAEVLDKVADLRITVVGDRVFCVRIESAANLLDWRSTMRCRTRWWNRRLEWFRSCRPI
jgi:hypothetical protein